MAATTRPRRRRATRPSARPATIGPAALRGATGSGGRAASTALVVLLLAGAAVFAYHTSFAGVFVYDDEYAIQRNPNIRALWPLTQAMSAPPESPVSARPVASLTLAVNYALAPPEARDVTATGGPGAPPDVAGRFLANVWGYHAMNLALHVLAALALFGVVRRTLMSDRLRPRFGPVSTALATAVALVWGVHPLTTDAVTYITQRTEVLMGLFYLVTLYCAIRGAEPGLNRVRRAAWTAATVVACALGMGSKQTMVTAPFVVLVWDWMFGASRAEALLHRNSSPRRESAPAVGQGFSPGRQGSNPQRESDTSSSRRESVSAVGQGFSPVRESRAKALFHRFKGLRWGLYAALAATWVILAAGLAYERWPHSIGINREGWTAWTYLLTQAGVIVHYLRLSFVPAPLVLDYDGWPMAHSLLDVAPQAVLLLALLGATAVAVIRQMPWGFPGAWFFALLAPSSSVLPLATEIAAERRMYTALAGVVALVVIGTYALGRRVPERLAAGARVRRAVTAGALVVLACVAGGLALVTADRNRVFWSEESIWRDVVDKRPDDPRARLNYGVILGAEHRYPEAEAQLRESLRLKEPVAKAHLNLGSILCAQQRFAEGLPHLQRAVALDPELPTSHANLGEAYGALGRRVEAAREFALAVQGEPDNVFLLNRLGWLLATSPEDEVRNAAKAVEVAERAVRLTQRQDPESLDTLAAAYAEAGRFADAAAAESEALELASKRGTPDPALADRLTLYTNRTKYREPR